MVEERSTTFLVPLVNSMEKFIPMMLIVFNVINWEKNVSLEHDCG